MFDRFFDYVLDGIEKIEYFSRFIFVGVFIAIVLGVLSFFQQNGEFSASLINNSITILGISFIALILYLGNRGKQAKAKEFIDLVDEINNGNLTIDGFDKIRKSKFSVSKSFFRYKLNPAISIGLYSDGNLSDGNLFIGMNRKADLIKRFLEENGSKWEKTNEGYGVYCIDDLDILNKEIEEIVERMKKYAELIKKCFPKV